MRLPISVGLFRLSFGLCLAVLALGLGSLPAGAVDLINRDAAAHNVTLIQAGQPTRFVIGPHVTFHRVCNACTVDIDGTQRIDAEDNDSVTIHNGVPQIGG